MPLFRVTRTREIYEVAICWVEAGSPGEAIDDTEADEEEWEMISLREQEPEVRKTTVEEMAEENDSSVAECQELIADFNRSRKSGKQF